jgi:hypothetical protein
MPGMGRIGGKTRASFKKAADRIDHLRANLQAGARSGLRMIGEEILLDVKASRPGAGVPVDKGVLRSTGTVDGPPPDANRVTLSFGGAAAPYALEQHENMRYHHKVGEPRYLVRGLERWQAHGLSVSKALAELNAAIAKMALTS